MIFESAIDNYKGQAIWKRMLLLVVLSIIPSVMTFFEDGQSLHEELSMAKSARDSSAVKFKNARKRKTNLPVLEEQLSYTQEQLLLASKKLPDEFIIEKVLQKVSVIAQDLGLKLQEFDPGQGQPAGGLFKYVEMPIHLKLLGTFAQTATFFDRVVHLELLSHIKNIEMTATSTIDESLSKKTSDVKLSSDTMQKIAREKLKISSNAEMVIFRTMNETEESALTSIIKNKE
ncbi:MAG: type 4a pilus biogenesis protein PilO [Deltaproteobacteria bacterium]|nr:type 4a pilus biogenesis protein PilO [Deltaproteobacteria bacterium]